jgi:hypothetical protein
MFGVNELKFVAMVTIVFYAVWGMNLKFSISRSNGWTVSINLVCSNPMMLGSYDRLIGRNLTYLQYSSIKINNVEIGYLWLVPYCRFSTNFSCIKKWLLDC